MSRTTYVFVRQADGSFAAVVKGTEPERVNVDSGALWGDRGYEGLRATDGTDISSRTRHREYMRQHGLTTIDDYTQTWAKAQADRDRYRTGQGGGAVTRDDIARAFARRLDR